MKKESRIKDWKRMHESLGFGIDGKESEELVADLKRKAATKKRQEDKVADTGL